ncbi:hypothetical protein NC981_21580 [Leptolyngbya sp. DQ-M1]|uniref:hypothetical protein n=1 Tax=Leptolyngbya sp. DQ-M1 TaxID=2933920 RepID=UPI0032998386
MSKTLSTAQSFIVDLAIASQAFLKECAQANRCAIDELDEEMIREYAATQVKRKK